MIRSIFLLILCAIAAHAQDTKTATEVVAKTPGLVAFWTFGEEAGQPRSSTGTKAEHPLTEVGGPIARSDGGPFSGYSAELNGKQYFKIPYAETGDLNISGKDAQVSMFAVVRIIDLKQSRTIAGMWSEGQGANDDSGTRQYALLMNMPTYGGPRRLVPHISSEGGVTRRADGSALPWCADYAATQREVPEEKWCSLGFTYDGKYLRAYIDGVLDVRPLDAVKDRRDDPYFTREGPDGMDRGMNPYFHGRGIFTYDPALHATTKPGGGSDFTVGARYAVGKMLGEATIGRFGGLAVFNRALTDAEMLKLHSAANVARLNAAPAAAQPAAFRLETDGLPLLRAWGDGLRAQQVREGVDRGGFLCPATKIVPGRSADAVYPLLALYRRTGEEKYRQAALEIFDWSERRISQPDGSWINEVNVPWKGITAFSLIALGEALRHDGDALAPADALRWRERLRKGADFLLGYMTFETGDLNYPLSSAASLAVAAKVLGDAKYLPRARELAHFALRHRTANGLLWGEGERGPDDLSPRGLRPVDVPYNVEESLPNLALYAELTGDKEIEEFVVAGLRAHLAFLLPDGAWDAGWAARQYKWAWWGSRTCDGAAHGFQMLRAHDPRFAAAAARNLQLLRACTHDGLLYGGPDVHARGLPPAIQLTIFRAKSLAAALDAGTADSPAAALPTEAADGLRAWPEAGVVQFARGGWRGSATVNDIPQSKKRGGQPSGGALSLLWHEKTGPLCVASMNDYVRYEGLNMQKPASDADQHCLTPRLELRADGRVFSSIHDRAAQWETRDRDGRIEITIRGTLRDKTGTSPASGPVPFECAYRVTAAAFSLTARVEADGVILEVPLVSPAAEPVRQLADGRVEIEKPAATVQVSATGGDLRLTNTARVFNFVPGMEALPLHISLDKGKEATFELSLLIAR